MGLGRDEHAQVQVRVSRCVGGITTGARLDHGDYSRTGARQRGDTAYWHRPGLVLNAFRFDIRRL